MTEEVVVVKETTPSFIRRTGELTKTQKRLSKLSESMIDFLLSKVEDEGVDLKLRMQYADKLLSYHVDVSKLVNQDNLQRMVAEIKIAGKLPLSGDASGNKTTQPVIDFDNIISV